MNIFKINDMTIKKDNYEHQIEHFFRLGSIYKKLSRPINAITPPPPYNMQNEVGVPPWHFDNI
jgi:hypothetical protein